MRNIVRVRMQGSSRVRPCPSVFRNALVSLCKSSFTPMARPLAAVSAAMDKTSVEKIWTVCNTSS